MTTKSKSCVSRDDLLVLHHMLRDYLFEIQVELGATRAKDKRRSETWEEIGYWEHQEGDFKQMVSTVDSVLKQGYAVEA